MRGTGSRADGGLWSHSGPSHAGLRPFLLVPWSPRSPAPPPREPPGRAAATGHAGSGCPGLAAPRGPGQREAVQEGPSSLRGVPSGRASRRQMAGVPVSLPTLGADAKVGRSRVLKGPEDAAAAAALLSGLAQGQPPAPAARSNLGRGCVRCQGMMPALRGSPAACPGSGCRRGWRGAALSPGTLLGVAARSVPWISAVLGEGQLAGGPQLPGRGSSSPPTELLHLGDLERKVPPTPGSWCLHPPDDTM